MTTRASPARGPRKWTSTRHAALVPIAAVALACGTSAESSPTIGVTREAIIGGTADATHTAVVALLKPDAAEASGLSRCSGTVIKVDNGIGYVLTAAHCCTAQALPALVVAASDFDPYVDDVGIAHPKAPAYAVVPDSIRADPQYVDSAPSHDFCLLQFWGAQPTMPTIPLAASAANQSGGLEFVGFGRTQETGPGASNSQRFSTKGTYQYAINGDYVEYHQEGVGTCKGDSGGPVLIPAGAPQSSQQVYAVTSMDNCSEGSWSSLVASAFYGFITNYFATIPRSPVQPGTACDKCWDEAVSVGGACDAAINSCDGNADCLAFSQCFNACSDPQCDAACRAAHPQGAATHDGIQGCVCTSACVSQCQSDCQSPDTRRGGDGLPPSVPGAGSPGAVAVDAGAPPQSTPGQLHGGRPVVSGCAMTPARSGVDGTVLSGLLLVLLRWSGRRRAA